MLEVLQSPPIVFNPSSPEKETVTADMRIDEIGWGDGRVVVDHDVSSSLMSPVKETALLLRIFFSKEGAANFANINVDTLQSRHLEALRLLGVHSVRAAVARMFDPQVGMLRVESALKYPEKATERETELFQLLTEDEPIKAASESSEYWNAETHKTTLLRRKDKLGEHVTTPMITLYGFMAGMIVDAYPRAPEGWSPPPRPQRPPTVSTAPEGLIITNALVPNENGLYLPHEARLPLDAALTFEGRSWKNAKITGFNVRGGRARINREHRLAHHLTELELRYLGAASLGLNDAQCEDTLYLPPAVAEDVRTTLYGELGYTWEDQNMMSVTNNAFRCRLLLAERPSKFALAAITDPYPDIQRDMHDIAMRGGNFERLRPFHQHVADKLQAIMDSSRKHMHIDDAGIVTVSYLAGILKPTVRFS